MDCFKNIKKNLSMLTEIAYSIITEIEAIEEKCYSPALSKDFEKINNLIKFKKQTEKGVCK